MPDSQYLESVNFSSTTCGPLNSPQGSHLKHNEIYHPLTYGLAPSRNSPDSIFIGEAEDESDNQPMSLDHFCRMREMETEGHAEENKNEGKDESDNVWLCDAIENASKGMGAMTLTNTELQARREQLAGIEALEKHNRELAEQLASYGRERQRWDKKEGEKDVVVIGISGASSSGKSLLGELLWEIFRKNGNQVSIISQDSFFLPKHLCPIRSFHSTLAEADFINETLRQGQLTDCIVIWDGTQHNTVSPTTPNLPPPRDAIFSMASQGDSQLQYTITGPDTDCNAAIDFRALYECIKSAIASPEIETNSANLGKSPHAKPDLGKYAIMIEKMRELVKINGLNENKRIVLVEGFLLFADPDVVSSSPIEVGDGEPVVFTMQDEADMLQPFDSASGFDNMSEEEIQERLEKADSLNAKRQVGMKEAIQGLLDIKLFLPVSYSEAKRRRFRRKEYVDFRKGGGRTAGQIWRSEGYFDEIVWTNYVREYNWLLEGKETGSRANGEGGVVEGVNIPSGLDVELEKSVKWAIEVILEETNRLCA